MPEFFIQQHATRDERGFQWLEGRAVPSAQWLSEFNSALRDSGVHPGSASALEGRPRQGGVYLSPSGDFGVLFAFRSADGPDSRGRLGAVVVNALFFKGHPFPSSSLRRAWESPFLNAGEHDKLPESTFISLDQNYGESSGEIAFFGAMKEWRSGRGMLRDVQGKEHYPCPSEEPAQPRQSRTSRPSSSPVDVGSPFEVPKFIGGLKLAGAFAAGLILGVGGAIVWKQISNPLQENQVVITLQDSPGNVHFPIQLEGILSGKLQGGKYILTILSQEGNPLEAVEVEQPEEASDRGAEGAVRPSRGTGTSRTMHQ